MSRYITVGLAMLAGAAFGAAAVQGLHAQAKPKAYTVSELETLDAAAEAAFVPVVQAAQRAAGGQPFRTGGGRIVAMEGTSAPKRVAITQWDSLEQAEAFYKSKAWLDLGPQREKAQKTIRRYVVEVVN
jgi:uncharacterized protein (DUF1330 family)